MKLSLAIVLLAFLPTAAIATDDKASNLRRRTQGTAHPPSIDQITFGYNVLLGMTPSQQRDSLVGSKLFDLTGDQRNNPEYIVYDQISDMSTSENCQYKGISNEMWYAQSSSSLQSQASSSSNGFDQEISVGAEIPVKGATVSAETRHQLLSKNRTGRRSKSTVPVAVP